MAPRRLLGQILKELGLIHEGMVQEALAVQREKGGRIGEILVAMKCIEPTDVARALASQAGLAYHDLAAVPPAQEAIARVDLASARAFAVLPVSLQGKVLKVANSGHLTVRAPAHAVGTVKVVVKTIGGTSNAVSFQYK